MTRFTAHLNALLSHHGWTKSELARRLNRSPSSLHPYLHGDYRPTRELLRDLFRAIELESFLPLLIAHLRDETPDAAQSDLLITPNTARVSEATEDVLSTLPSDVREDIIFLARRAEKSAAIRQMLSGNASVLRETS